MKNEKMPFVIAIDGYAGCGKSSTAKAVARELDFLYIDTGAMYRSIAWYFLQHGVDYSSDSSALQAALQEVHLSFEREHRGNIPVICLNGEPVEQYIRQPEVSGAVSQVAVHRSVREAMVEQQRRMGRRESVVMDGRDIGTVVFPHADLKVFMTAEMETRARRRLAELEMKGIVSNLEETIENLRERDRIDTSREIAPLKQAEDAVVLDTTHLDFQEQVRKVVNWATDRINSMRSS